jgi:hypothetical protein
LFVGGRILVLEIPQLYEEVELLGVHDLHAFLHFSAGFPVITGAPMRGVRIMGVGDHPETKKWLWGGG